MKVRLATLADDLPIARMLADAPLPGPVQLAFTCGTSFFGALQVEGEDPVACVAEHGGQIVGVGASTARPVYLGGDEVRARYMGCLRLHRAARGSRVIPRGFALLREALAARGEALVLTAVLDDNRAARRVLEGGRAGLPTYRPVASLITYAIPTAAACARVPDGVEQGSVAEEVADLLRVAGSRRDLFPVCRARDLEGGHRFPSLRASDFWVAREGRTLVGALACWDTRARRQIRVAGYEGTTRWLRPLANVAARMIRRGGLPRVGSELALCYAALGAVLPGAERWFRGLVQAVVAEAARRSCEWLVITLDARDERCAALETFPARKQRSTLYQVDFTRGQAGAWSVAGPLHVEAALL